VDGACPGNFKRQFGRKGRKTDGRFNGPVGIACDAHGNLIVLDATRRLQVFSSEGRHLCTRNDLGLSGSRSSSSDSNEGSKAVGWSIVGGLAVADGRADKVLVWAEEGAPPPPPPPSSTQVRRGRSSGRPLAGGTVDY
jgi:hypothetical protein